MVGAIVLTSRIRGFWRRFQALPPWTRPISDPLVAPLTEVPETPLVSVVMTAYNAAPWLEAAMDSILRQTWHNLELIVVDDASTDSTRKIIQQVSARDARVRSHRMPVNCGTYVAKNHGVSHASGDVITFMDSDDTSVPTRIAKQLGLLRTAGLVATTCNYVRVDDAGNIILNRGLEQRQALISLMVKRQVFEDIGWFDSVRFAADDEFFERLRHVYGRPAHANVAEPLYRALVRLDSLSGAGATPVNLSGEDSAALSPERARYKEAHAEWRRVISERRLRPYVPRGQSQSRAFY